jgi:hypothetical protein
MNSKRSTVPTPQFRDRGRGFGGFRQNTPLTHSLTAETEVPANTEARRKMALRAFRRVPGHRTEVRNPWEPPWDDSTLERRPPRRTSLGEPTLELKLQGRHASSPVGGGHRLVSIRRSTFRGWRAHSRRRLPLEPKFQSLPRSRRCTHATVLTSRFPRRLLFSFHGLSPHPLG